MTKIFEHLYTKPHNKHYLDRYVKFIKHCQTRNSDDDYYETHHIAPKASDLFPELKSDRSNLISLTAREHIIAHIMLWKAYGGSQAQAIECMIDMFNSDTNLYLSNRKIPTSIRIRYLANARKEASYYRGRVHINKATYKDTEGKRYYLTSEDPLIEELGLVGHNHGRLHTEETLTRLRGSRSFTLYNNTKREVLQLKGKYNSEVEEYLAKGWSFLQDEMWIEEEREEARQRQIKAARIANTGTPFYYPDGSYFGRLDKEDPLVEELSLRHIRSEKQVKQNAARLILAAKAKLGSNIWNNGVEERFCKESPGDDWIIGRLPRSEEWETKRANSVSSRISGSTTWTDGVRNYRLKEGDKPEPHWVKGMKPRKK